MINNLYKSNLKKKHSINISQKAPFVQLGNFKAWIIVTCASLFFFFEFLQMNMFNSINANLMRDLNINGAQVSALSAYYFYADVLFLFPAGVILDRFSVRKVIILALSLCSISTIMFSFADSFYFAAAARALSGVGAAFCFLSIMRLATRWFPSKKLASVTGFIVTMAMLGGMIAQTPFAILNHYFGWRNIVLFDGLLGFLFLLAIVCQVRDFPSAEHRKEIFSSTNAIKFWPSAIGAWKNIQNWLGGCYASFLNLPILVIGALWGTEYLIQVHHLDHKQAATVSMMLFLGTIIGSPIVGWLSDRIQRRKSPMIVAALLSIFVALLIIYFPNLNFFSLLCLFFALGFITSAQIISYPLIVESNLNPYVGRSLGWASVLIMGGGALGQPLFGWLLNLHWQGTMANNIPLYSVADYQLAWLIFPIMFFVALLVACCIRETHCQTYETLSEIKNEKLSK